ncbi:uncharacterized protein LOC141766874 [Sebastes fasciatus]|uniref:uncharacterized protein LOC141766874 n=1 Tax=Sebastes fasciatus TaxID=394691 RepID=UPI003D9F885F
MENLPQLPPEVLVNVFSYLSTEEKHAVRASSRHLKQLIDQPSLWRDDTVVLSDLHRYTDGFWDTLNRRKVTRVARTYNEKYLDNLALFPELRDLGVRNLIWDEAMLGRSLSLQLKDRMTHLSVCNVDLPCRVDFINTVAQLVNLRYLLFHQQDEDYMRATVRPLPCGVFHNLLLSLRKLQHLSWGMEVEPPEHPGAARYGGPALTSLELVGYPETILIVNELRSLTSLRSLTVRYREGIGCSLTSCLSPLQQLESLTIIGGNSLAAYTTTIPSSVTRLMLRVAITLQDVDSIAPNVPGLEHLDIEQNRTTGSLCRRIPMLFPQLRTLRIWFFHREPENDLLSLHHLRHLVQLELLVDPFILRDYLNGHPWPSPCVQGLMNQLRELSENRITVITTMHQRNPLRECDCVGEETEEGEVDFIPPEEEEEEEEDDRVAIRDGNRRLT